ncbi:hypothetical protein AN478_06940 [Thiohalorhabdus denitrificans]|uniref:Swt1-like HEPN domain-containing protein n=1 Tax=Thiohalorhabdus denitrificans TaxID=381306 RepID=A0A0P9EN14_9GAMM|nr:DUF499 domain-containing protein [Thiohalorhabdus denitrificans]KPV39926.1 hypothetical protein AN478_06940 [Thiohalorhabdus denitrificans]SCY08718.1 hypothetical protein SAMN05661077_1144 [Thiohalorhabdus denitrificans]
MAIKPWREIAKPHRDVLEGTFQQSEFAADISQVQAGSAPAEYGDAEGFFNRTYITEGMRLLLISVAQRLAGQGGDPVIQLQTAFGGGKTHTLLAVYHLASREVSTDRLAGIPPVLDEAGVQSLPYSRIAVLDGNNLAPSQPQNHDGHTVNTLWGELAWQLLGAEGYQLVSGSDAEGTSPGKEVLIGLLKEAAPCAILIDELLAFIRQFEPGHQYPAGTYDSNLSFIQALTEAVKSVPDAVILASLPESELEAGSAHGAQTLVTLEKYFARVESVWKPLAAEEAFEVVRRRLFDTTGEEQAINEVCAAFFDYYRENSDKLPQEVQEESYRERLRQTYPIHPEIFDRLYQDWSTLEKFQRTRGVLQLMAVVIHRLWSDNDQDPLIMPGSLPLYDSTVRNKSIHYLPQGWEPVIDAEVDGPGAETQRIDNNETRFGSVQAARRVARAVFLGSAPDSSPSAAGQHARGLPTERIFLGCGQPGQTLGLYEDVLKRLRDRLQYLYADRDRFWLDTRPNLRRDMENRKSRLNDAKENLNFLKGRVERIFGKDHSLGGIHVFTPSGDIPDEYGVGPRLVVLPPDAAYGRTETRPATEAAEERLRNRGDQPRQHQNRLIFLAPDRENVDRLKDQVRSFRAWSSILEDFKADRVVYDNTQWNEAQQAVQEAEKTLTQLIRETFKWLVAPYEEFTSQRRPELKWEGLPISTSATNLIQEIEHKLKEEELVVYEWSPIHLRQILGQYYFGEDRAEVSALQVWQDICNYLFLPRLLNDNVFEEAIAKGVESEDYFGFSAGKEGDRYLGFLFGNTGSIQLGEESLLIEREAAAKYKAQLQPKESAWSEPGASSSGTTESVPGTSGPSPEAGPETGAGVSPDSGKTQFYGTVHLDPVMAKMNFSNIMDEVVEHFSAQAGVEVKISVEVQARSKSGFDEQIQRVVKENSNSLGFSFSEFEEGD